MKNTQPKITLSRSEDIPFHKLVLSQSNVRRIKAGISVEDLAEDIARRGLLQSICVRPVREADGTETGLFEIPAGGRRYRALELLVKQKRMAKTQPVPCVVIRGDAVSAEEDSLAENVQRVALHPLDQFRAFQTLRTQGIGEEEMAGRLHKAAEEAYAEREQRNSPEAMRYVEKQIILQTLDHLWRDHLVTLDHLRQVIGWRGMAQRDPLNEYKSEAFELFRQLIAQWHEAVVAQMMRVEVRFQAPEPPPPPMQFEHLDPQTGLNEEPLGAIAEPILASGFAASEVTLTAAPDDAELAERDPQDPATWGKVGRNEACPCGSGKKFKHCHGQLA